MVSRLCNQSKDPFRPHSKASEGIFRNGKIGKVLNLKRKHLKHQEVMGIKREPAGFGEAMSQSDGF